MLEVCSAYRTYSEAGPSSPFVLANRGYNAPRIHAQVGMNAVPEFSSRYQNLLRNPYGLLPRPPQTQAAHFKRLYRK
jgi:hypothetical protein